jgi:hypothetical protein
MRMAGEESQSDPALLAIAALLAADRSEREPEPAIATEVVLSAAGLSNQLIANILGKKPDAVRMKINRAKATAKKPRAKSSKK